MSEDILYLYRKVRKFRVTQFFEHSQKFGLRASVSTSSTIALSPQPSSSALDLCSQHLLLTTLHSCCMLLHSCSLIAPLAHYSLLLLSSPHLLKQITSHNLLNKCDSPFRNRFLRCRISSTL